MNDKEQYDLDTLRHSCAHLMAQAVKQLYPETQVTIGPVIEDGFYYDFFREEPFVPEDLKKIEKRMKEIAKKGLEITRQELPRDEAIEMFRKMGEPFKIEIIEGIDGTDAISAYTQGDFTDFFQVFWNERFFAEEVIVKPVFAGRARPGEMDQWKKRKRGANASPS